MSCPLCERVKLIEAGKYPYLIHEFKHSYFMLGEHQFFKGYGLVVTKDHYKEMTSVPKGPREELFKEMMVAHETIEQVFQPDKMNMCSLGNKCPHIHWHFFPRYKSDEKFGESPWLRNHLFTTANVTPEEAAQTIQQIQKALPANL